MNSFIALAFAISWILWGLSAVIPALSTVLRILGTFGPACAALILVWPDGSRRTRLLQRLLQWRLSGWTYAYALLLPVVGIAAALAVTAVIGVDGPVWPPAMPVFIPVIVFFYVLIFSVAGEELGWRGFALPALLERFGPVAASLLLGAIWAIWHAPLFMLPGSFHADIPPLLFGIQIIASSLIYKHLHLATEGSLVPAHLFHASFNANVGLWPVLPVARDGDATALTIAVVLLCLVAVGAAIAIRRRRI